MVSPITIHLESVDKDWTLFIDRDGVINYEKKGDYILNWKEFRFYENAPQLFRDLGTLFHRIIVVSNQRGVGKQLMTEEDLRNIHEEMKKEIEKAGGRIDGIYYCTSVDDGHPDRKPNPGMAYRAQHDFPDINLTKSIIVGNKPSDMQFGRNAGMVTVFLATTHPETPFPHPDIDFRFNSLAEFVKAL